MLTVRSASAVVMPVFFSRLWQIMYLNRLIEYLDNAIYILCASLAFYISFGVNELLIDSTVVINK